MNPSPYPQRGTPAGVRGPPAEAHPSLPSQSPFFPPRWLSPAPQYPSGPPFPQPIHGRMAPGGSPLSTHLGSGGARGAPSAASAAEGRESRRRRHPLAEAAPRHPTCGSAAAQPRRLRVAVHAGHGSVQPRLPSTPPLTR